MINPASMPYRVEYFLELARHYDERMFLAELDSPVLVLDREEDFDDEEEFSTSTDYRLDYREAIEDGRIADPASLLYLMSKRTGANHFSRMIMIGRVASCDIVVLRAQVSKFHAFVLRKELDGRETFFISDGRSRNGTSVNRKRLRSGTSSELRSGDSVHLGTTVTLRYYSPRDFYRLLRSL